MLPLLELLFLVVKSYVVYRVTRASLLLARAVFYYRLAPLLFGKPTFGLMLRQWAVITGCTDGIGKAYAKELARCGLKKFLLIGRNKEKLEVVTEELQNINKHVETVSHVFDFSTGDFSQLGHWLSHYQIGFLLNCAGVAPKLLKKFPEQQELNRTVLRVNTIASMEMMHAVLPQMRAQGFGVVVNMSSSQAMRPIPLLSSYSASKVALCYLSECARTEYREYGVTIQCLIPLVVATKMTKMQGPDLFVVTPDHFAREAVSVLGRSSMLTGCFNHEVQMSLLYMFPWWLVKHVVRPIYEYHALRLQIIYNEMTDTRGQPNIANGLI